MLSVISESAPDYVGHDLCNGELPFHYSRCFSHHSPSKYLSSILNRVSSHVRPRQNKKTTPLYNVFPNCTPVIISLEHIPGASPGVKLIPRPIWCRPSGGSSSRQWSREMGVDGEHLALLRVSAFNAVVQNTMLSQKDRMGWNVSEACERSMPLEGEKGCRQ